MNFFFIQLSLFTFIVFPLVSANPSAPETWTQEYHELQNRIRKNFDEPPEKSPLETHLKWMEIKADDRNRVKDLYEEASRLSRQNPEDGSLKQWAKRFSDLLKFAQASGESTANGAAMFYMYIRDNRCPKCGNWQEVIGRLKTYGRRIYLKASETRFLTPTILKRARCMINFSIRSVEADEGGFGVYRGRQGFFGEPDGQGNIVIPDRDFDIDCEPRNAFVYTSRGEPDKPTDKGLEWINEVRKEARWWRFSDAEKDAYDLMEEFFKDSMCKVPPNGCNHGHRYYENLAKKYRLSRGLKYNREFYGTVFGKVEISSPSRRKPVKNAKITIKSLVDGATWEGFTDEAGRYEINHVLLHKECKPLRMTVSFGDKSKSETFKGPLEKPDPTYRHEKNFVFHTAKKAFKLKIDARWNYDDSTKKVRYVGFFKGRIAGSLKLKNASGDHQMYLLDNMSVSYDFNSEAIDLSKECHGKIVEHYYGKGKADPIEPGGLNIFFGRNQFVFTTSAKGKGKIFERKSRTSCDLHFSYTRPMGFLIMFTGPIEGKKLTAKFQWQGTSSPGEPVAQMGNQLVYLDLSSIFFPGSTVKNVDCALTFNSNYNTSKR